MTALHFACEQHKIETAKALVAAGARVDALARFKTSGACPVEVQATPLACAARLGNAEVVAELLACGADPNLGDHSDPVRSAACASLAARGCWLRESGA